jgi:hypothetical protein
MGEVIEFPGRVCREEPGSVRRRSRWRHITREEYELLVLFSQNPDLWGSSPFARSMVEAARAGRPITDKQGAAIFEVARDWGLMGSPAMGNEPAAS